MPILTAAATRALIARFQVASDGSVLYVDALTSVGVELHVTRNPQATDLSAAITRLTGEFDTLSRILERTEWQRQMARAGHLDHTSWLFYATCDMEYFYMVLRAVFDHVASVCIHIPVRTGLVPSNFGSLLAWCEREPLARTMLGDAVVTALLDCHWFHPMRLTRNHLVHHGAFALAMPAEQGAIGFRVYSDPQHLQSIPAALHLNENLADLELYMAWTMGNLLQLFDVLGTALRGKYLQGPALEVSGQSPGHRLHRQQLERLADAFERHATDAPSGIA